MSEVMRRWEKKMKEKVEIQKELAEYKDVWKKLGLPRRPTREELKRGYMTEYGTYGLIQYPITAEARRILKEVGT
jgi:hypothetical protein